MQVGTERSVIPRAQALVPRDAQPGRAPLPVARAAAVTPVGVGRERQAPPAAMRGRLVDIVV